MKLIDIRKERENLINSVTTRLKEEGCPNSVANIVNTALLQNVPCEIQVMPPAEVPENDKRGYRTFNMLRCAYWDDNENGVWNTMESVSNPDNPSDIFYRIITDKYPKRFSVGDVLEVYDDEEEEED